MRKINRKKTDDAIILPYFAPMLAEVFAALRLWLRNSVKSLIDGKEFIYLCREYPGFKI